MRDPRQALTWLLAPATDEAPRAQAVAASGLRILVGLMWLYNVSWKRAPNFGEEAGNGLYKFTSFAVEHPVFPPYSWVVETFVLPNFQIFGWMVLAAETTLAVLLLTGSFVRVAAAIGLAQSAAIGLSVAFAPEEWPWSYWLMIGIHAYLLFSSAGRYAAVDAVRAGLHSPRTLMQGWGGLAVLVGLFGILGSLSEPLAASGARLGSTDVSMSLGSYNLLGGLLLAAAGGLLVAAASVRAAWLSVLAGTVAVLCGLSLHAQLGFTDPLLGGSTTSAAFFFCVALVAYLAPRGSTSPSTGASPSRRQAV